MWWLALALAIELTPARAPQGHVVTVKAPAAAVSARWLNRNIPLFPDSEGVKTGLLPIPAMQAPRRYPVTLRDAKGRVLGRRTVQVLNARFRTQNIRLGKAVQGLGPSPGEMEMVAKLRNSVSPVRYWSEPFAIPTDGCLTSPYGVRRLHNGKPTGRYHSGIDQRGAEGVPVRATADGIVKIVRKFNIHGDTVGIDHGQGVTSIYLHLSAFATTEGASVKKGDVIGYVGSTGRSTAPHLHWGINVHARPVNPTQWMKIPPCAARR